MALWGIGTKFQRQVGGVWQDIGEITSIGPPESTMDTQDATTLDSPQGREQVVPTILRNGEATLSFNFDPDDADQKSFRTDMNTRTKRSYRIVFPDENFYQFDAYVVGFQIGEITPDGLLTANITLKATGAPGFSSDARLASLVISGVTLSPTFDGDVTSYAATTSDATNTVTATAEDNEATVEIKVNNSSHTSGQAATWDAGVNTVVVTVTNGEHSKTYVVVVTKTGE